MALYLIDSSPASVIRHPGGLITVRCADFPGAARGTLTTPSDAFSVAGDVLRDEQTIAVQTTFTSTSTRFSSASDTFTIPLSSIPREESINYSLFLSLRLEGEPPTNAVARSNVFSYHTETGAGLGVGFSVNGSFHNDIDWIPKEDIEIFSIKDFESTLFSSSTTGDLAIRAWGITGGDVAIFLDTLYLIPSGDNLGFGVGNYWHQNFPSNYQAFRPFTSSIFRDSDNDNLWWPGKFSVLEWEPPFVPGAVNWGQLTEFQEADSEPTSANMEGDEDWSTEPEDPKSWFWMLAGGANIPEKVLITDDFTLTADTADLRVQEIGNGYLRVCEVGTAAQIIDFWIFSPQRRGFFVNEDAGGAAPEGLGVATCYFGDSTGLPDDSGSTLPFGLNPRAKAELKYGAANIISYFSVPSPSPSDPRNYYSLFGSVLTCFEVTCRTRLLDNAVRASANIGIVDEGDFKGAWLQFDGTDLDLYLMDEFNFAGEWFILDGPISISTSYSLGDWYWLKVQKRGYYWRAKAWADGDTEPTSWTSEGYQPIMRSGTGTEYPWDDNWLTMGSGGLVRDPRQPLESQATPQFDNLPVGFQATCELEQARCRVQVDDLEIKWNPSSGTPGDIFVRMEKHDGSVDYGTVTVPYGSHRIIADGRDYYHFDQDTNGVNISAWKESGSPDFMSAGLGRIFERVPIRGGPIHLESIAFRPYQEEPEEEE